MSIEFGNIPVIVGELKKVGFTNEHIINGILATVGKESGFVPKSEYTYRNTDNDRLRRLFGKDLSMYSDSELTKLKQDDIAFYDAIYGGEGGNNEKGDGFKYKGRGLNQITFKNTYAKYSKLTGVDLIKNPDKMNEIGTASKATAIFFKNTLLIPNPKMKSRFGVTDVNTIKDSTLGVQLAVNANAGWGGEDKRGSETEKKAFDYLKKIEEFTKGMNIGGNSDSKKKVLMSLIVLGSIALICFGLINKKTKLI